MAVGDVIDFGPTNVATGAYLDLQPGSGECVVHNVCYTADVELYFYDGTNLVGPIYKDTSTTGGSLLNTQLHCTNTKYYRVKNTNGASKYISADGVVTK